MKLGIIGCGAIGGFIAQEVDKGHVENMELASLFDIDPSRAHIIAQNLKSKPRVFPDFDSFLALEMDIVLESASQDALKKYAFSIIESGKDLVVMSAGALSDEDFRERLFDLVKSKNRRLYIPSGAVAGLDGLKAFSNVKILRASLTTRKPPQSLGGVELREPVVLFKGSAIEAAKKFPQNINVAIALGLAGDMLGKLEVTILSDPAVSLNEHVIEVESEAGEMKVILRNKPFPLNPKTSFLAALSCLEMLKSIGKNIVIGG